MYSIKQPSVEVTLRKFSIRHPTILFFSTSLLVDYVFHVFSTPIMYFSYQNRFWYGKWKLTNTVNGANSLPFTCRTLDINKTISFDKNIHQVLYDGYRILSSENVDDCKVTGDKFQSRSVPLQASTVSIFRWRSMSTTIFKDMMDTVLWIGDRMFMKNWLYCSDYFRRDNQTMSRMISSR